MKIIYLITGSGGSFYCANCYRDMLYVRAIRKVPGTTSKAIPLYLPPDEDVDKEHEMDTHVFFGAISMYLREKVRIFRNMPMFLEKFFRLKPFLKLAARMAGTTRSEGLEEMTLNMIKGDATFRKDEVYRLVNYLNSEGKPDIIHLSNALILGLARQLKKWMDVKIVCSLLNEDDWVIDMAQEYQSKAWKMMAEESEYIDAFITPSRYSKEQFIRETGVKGDNIHIVPLGFDPPDYKRPEEQSRPLTIGYFDRVSEHNGFDKLVDAFIDIKTKNIIPDLALHVCGGYTADDKEFIAKQIKKIRDNNLQKNIKICNEFRGDNKAEFFENVDVISVPVRKLDGYGLYILEANGAGIPVVQPATGAFPEILEMTGGGIIYSPDTVSELSKNLVKILTDNNLRKKLGETGSVNIRSKLSLDKMAESLSAIYSKISS